MNNIEKIKLYEEILIQHGYSNCSICNTPIINKNNKINIVKEEYNENKIKRTTIKSYHKNCFNKNLTDQPKGDE